jgi:hypothetical protein
MVARETGMSLKDAVEMVTVRKGADGDVGGGLLNQASKLSSAKNIGDFLSEISGLGKKRRFETTSDKGAKIDLLGSDIEHIQTGSHPLTGAQWQAVVDNLENVGYAAGDNVRGSRSGKPVQVKINTPLGKAGLLLEFLPNGKIYLANAVFNNDAALDNWIKNKKNSYTLGIDANNAQNRIAGNSSVYTTIQQALGIVKQGGETYNQTITNTSAFKAWFGDSVVTNKDGTPMIVYHSTDEDFSIFDKERLGGNTYGNASDDLVAATAGMGIWMNTAPLEQHKRAMPLYVKIENPARFDSLEDLANEIGSDYIAREKERITDEYDEMIEEAQEEGDGERAWELEQERDNAIDELDIDYDADPSTLAGISKEAFIEAGHDGIIIENDEEFGGTSYVVFDNNQVKSVDNAGEWDAENPDIYHQTAFHGSPFKFLKFLLSKINTGEGAQVYGWGLYFAENMNIAENQYRKKLLRKHKNTTSSYKVDGESFTVERDSEEDFAYRAAISGELDSFIENMAENIRFHEEYRRTFTKARRRSQKKRRARGIPAREKGFEGSRGQLCFRREGCFYRGRHQRGRRVSRGGDRRP